MKIAIVTIQDGNAIVVGSFKLPEEWIGKHDHDEIDETIRFHFNERVNLDDPDRFGLIREEDVFIDNDFKILNIEYYP